MEKLNAENYQIKELNLEQKESLERNLTLLDSLKNQLIFVQNLETDDAIEEDEKSSYVLLINNQINKLSKLIIENFYEIKQ